jgi:hypothetical protein
MTQHRDSVREILTALTTPAGPADGAEALGEPGELTPVCETAGE